MDNQQIYNDFTTIIESLKLNSIIKNDIPINKNIQNINDTNIKHIETVNNDNIKQTTKKLRCALCKVKISAVNTIISSCKCDKNYCLKHRMPESHNCEKLEQIIETQKKNLATSLIKVEFSKLDRL
jgi:predicted nucleic acid binding AN1-type Zn finger protein